MLMPSQTARGCHPMKVTETLAARQKRKRESNRIAQQKRRARLKREQQDQDSSIAPDTLARPRQYASSSS